MTTQIRISAEIGTRKQHCWLCDYTQNAGAYCNLFRKRLEQKTYSEGGEPPLRCEDCIDAEKNPTML